jgi:molybdopterin-binding protein
MALSARNRLRGTVRSVTKTDVVAEVVVELDGGETVTAIITSGSAERLGLDPGSEVDAVVKATEVMIDAE